MPASADIASVYMSHPSRVRGLKHVVGVLCCGPYVVAPLAGAWIETKPWLDLSYKMKIVAPLAGAWIETVN